MNRRDLAHSIVLLFLLSSIGCRDSGPDSNSTQLQNILWTLQSFETIGGITDTIADGRTYSILFVSDTITRVRADCNECTGSYHASAASMGAHVSIGNLSCTKVYCGPSSLDVQFLNALSAATDYSLQGDLLRLFYNERQRVLNLRRGF